MNSSDTGNIKLREMVFGKFVTFVFGGVVGAYGMHQYIDAQVKKGVFPDWAKISTDMKFAYDSTSSSIQKVINQEDTQKTIQKIKENSNLASNDASKDSKSNIQSPNVEEKEDVYKRLKRNIEETY